MSLVILPGHWSRLTAPCTAAGPSVASSFRRRTRSRTSLAAAASTSASCTPARLRGPSAAGRRNELLPLFVCTVFPKAFSLSLILK